MKRLWTHKRGKDSECTDAEANDHVSSNEIRVEVHAPTYDDNKAHLKADADSEDEEVRHEDVEEYA